MGTAEVGLTADTAAQTATPHPSARIDVHGPAIGSHLRVGLGDSGFRVFPVMLGGAEFGWSLDERHSHDILDRYRALGGNAVHTSDGYASGRSEYIIGRWLTDRRARDEMVLGVRIGTHPDNPGLGSVNLVRAVEASLTRLATDRIDVLYLDGTDTRTPMEDTLATAEWLVETGKVRSLGAYGLTAERLVEARILSSAGYPRITALDVPYSLVRREDFEGDLRFVAGAQGLAVTPSHALAHGFLSGKYRSRAGMQGARGMQMLSAFSKRSTRLLRVLDSLAAVLGVPVAAVALAWLRAQRSVVAPIVNAHAPDHVDELVQSVGISLGRAQLSEITRALA